MMKNKKRLFIILMSSILFITVIYWIYLTFVPREQLLYGIPDQDGNTSMGVESTSRSKIRDVHVVIDTAKKIDVDEEPAGTKQVQFSLDTRTHNDTERGFEGMIWYQEDDTAILKNLLEDKYYEVDKQHTDTLKRIIKVD